MDMQNVSNLVIPEGEVKAIHDKNGNLLWGRLAYNTKYAGDTYQQTYSGKNLFDGTYVNYAIGGGSGHGWFANANSRSAVIKCSPNTVYSIKKYETSNRFVICDYPTNPTATTEINLLLSDSSVSEATVTTHSDAEYLFVFVSNASGEPQMQIEQNSSPTSYEPYTGGIPAPNPYYTQAVQTVAGEQTVTISDGVDSEDFAISLGTVEFCKIGTYQDYIYNSGDDWYVHKTTGKIIVDGSYGGYNSTFNWYYCAAAQYGGESPSSSAVCVGNLFRYIPFVTFKPNTSLIGMSVENGGFRLRNTACSSASDYQTWLSNNNLILYYQLATTTDTKITDATLVGQLNAVHEWLTRCGYNAAVSGNLPIIIDRTNL